VNADIEDRRQSAADVYVVRRGDPLADRERVLNVWRECGSSFSQEFVHGRARYDWFYLRNPAGRAAVYFLEHRPSGQLVGVLGIAAREFWRAGVSTSAGVLVDFVVHPRHRVFYPAFVLQRAARDAELESRAMLIGHPNTSSVAVFRRLGGYQERVQGRFVRILGVRQQLLRSASWPLASSVGGFVEAADRQLRRGLRAFGPRFEFRWSEHFDGRFDDLWNRVAREALIIGTRDRAFLEWRFGARPGHRYRIGECRYAGRERLEGYCICQESDGLLNVVDVLVVGDVRAHRAALDALLDAAGREGARGVVLNVVPHRALASAMRSLLFVRRSATPVVITVRPATQADLSRRATAAEWYVTPADADF
jgi:hypothetical protein